MAGKVGWAAPPADLKVKPRNPTIFNGLLELLGLSYETLIQKSREAAAKPRSLSSGFRASSHATCGAQSRRNFHFTGLRAWRSYLPTAEKLGAELPKLLFAFFDPKPRKPTGGGDKIYFSPFYRLSAKQG